jgi:hypothetical protein
MSVETIDNVHVPNYHLLQMMLQPSHWICNILNKNPEYSGKRKLSGTRSCSGRGGGEGGGNINVRIWTRTADFYLTVYPFHELKHCNSLPQED